MSLSWDPLTRQLSFAMSPCASSRPSMSLTMASQSRRLNLQAGAPAEVLADPHVERLTLHPVHLYQRVAAPVDQDLLVPVGEPHQVRRQRGTEVRLQCLVALTLVGRRPGEAPYRDVRGVSSGLEDDGRPPGRRLWNPAVREDSRLLQPGVGKAHARRLHSFPILPGSGPSAYRCHPVLPAGTSAPGAGETSLISALLTSHVGPCSAMVRSMRRRREVVLMPVFVAEQAC